MSDAHYALPRDVKLQAGSVYGLRPPTEVGHEPVLIPYILIKNAIPEDVILIRATSESEYEIVHVDENTDYENFSVQSSPGLMPHAFEEPQVINPTTANRPAPTPSFEPASVTRVSDGAVIHRDDQPEVRVSPAPAEDHTSDGGVVSEDLLEQLAGKKSPRRRG